MVFSAESCVSNSNYMLLYDTLFSGLVFFRAKKTRAHHSQNVDRTSSTFELALENYVSYVLQPAEEVPFICVLDVYIT